jgi:membrane-associated phospholipid phosphatase
MAYLFMMNFTSNRMPIYLLTCLVIFCITWYDSAHAHIWTNTLNHYITASIVLPAQPVGESQILYHSFLSAVTDLGNNFVFAVVMLPLCAYLLYKKQIKLLVLSVIAAVVSIMLSKFFKTIVHSPRPIPYELADGSFPSGHVTRVMVWCGIIMCLGELKVIVQSRYVKYLLILIPILVAFSRLALGRHWFSDVIGAFALVGMVLLVMYAFQRYATRTN